MAANKTSNLPALLLLACCAPPLAAAAAESRASRAPGIEVRFAGEVVEVEGVSSVAIGTPVSGRYRFDPRAQDFNPADTSLGLYDAVLDFEMSLGETQYSAASGTIGVLDDSARYGGEVDAYSLTCGPPLLGPAIDGLPPFQMDMNLADTAASVFDGVALPTGIETSALDIRAPARGLQTGGHLLLRDSASGKIGDVAFSVETLEFIPADDEGSGVLDAPD